MAILNWSNDLDNWSNDLDDLGIAPFQESIIFQWLEIGME
jgi:hypothetical protein